MWIGGKSLGSCRGVGGGGLMLVGWRNMGVGGMGRRSGGMGLMRLRMGLAGSGLLLLRRGFGRG